MTRTRKKQPESEHISPHTPAGLLDAIEAARWLGISRAKLFVLMHEKDFPVIRITEKLIRFDPNSLYHWALKRQNMVR